VAVRAVWEPDISLASPNPKIFYIHKRRGTLDIFYFCNMDGSPRELDISFHRLRRSASVCDPSSGAVEAVKPKPVAKGCTLRLPLAMLGAKFVVFG
jgi:hypothetical protein